MHRDKLFLQWQGCLRPINRTAGTSINKALDTSLQDRMLQHLDRSQLADEQVLFWVVHRVLVGEEGSQMKDVGGLLVKDTLEVNVISNAALDKQYIWQIRYVPGVGSREIIQDDYLGRTGFRQGSAEITANCSRTPGDEDGFINVGFLMIHNDLLAKV